MAEGRVQGLEQLFAEPGAGRDGEVGIVRNVGNAVEVRDLAMEHLAHEEVLGQANPTELFEGLHGGGLAHGMLLLGTGRRQDTQSGADGDSARP